MPRSSANSAHLILTTGCNLTCSYCYVQKIRSAVESMPLEIADKVMDFVDRQMPEGTLVHFFGGEPLLRFDIIKYIMTKYPTFSYSVVTNCTLLDEEKLEFLKDRKDFIGVLLSLDGTDVTQLKNRGQIPDYSIVRKAIAELTHDVRMMVVEPNDIIGNVKFLVDMGIKTIKMGIPTFQVNRAGYKADFITQSQLAKEMFPDIKFEPDRTSCEDKCFAFTGQRCFAPNGDIYPCDMFYHKKVFKIGHVDTGVDPALIEKFIKDTDGQLDLDVPCLAHKMFFGDKWINQ